MACYVTGIAPSSDIAQLETVAKAIAGIDQEKLTILTKSDRTYEHESSFLNFIHTTQPYVDSDAVGSLMANKDSLMTGGTGTSVPGIGGGHTALTSSTNDRSPQHVGSLPIPEDEADNYNDAIEDGRAVLAYACDPSQQAALEDAFRKAGVNKVKTFVG
jgi:hypothetical protein